MSDFDIKELEAQIEVAKRDRDFGQAILRLKENKDFKKVILEGYMEKEALRLIRIKAEPAMQNPLSQAAIVSAMDAISNLHHYLEGAIRDGEIGERHIQEGETVLEELLAEDLNNPQ